MGDNNIPIIEPTIDYTKVPPIHQKRTISFINHFVVNTVSSLNKLALTCEEKLFEFENKLQRVEAAVVILESRFASIPSSEIQPVDNNIQKNDAQESNKSEANEAQQDTVKDVDETDKEAAENQQTTEENTILITEHPRYEKYFRMLKKGVPKQGVIQQMNAEGVDPALLEDPQQRVPIDSAAA